MRILLVEDHAIVREALRSLLLEACSGVSVVDEAATGEEALAKLQMRPSYNLLLVDVNLPRMTGVELVAEAVRRWAHIPIVGITIAPTPKVVDMMTAAGARMVLDKQAPPQVLCEEVLGHLGGSRN